MKYLKTYGVPGLMEWQAVIPMGKASLKVRFSGGTLTAYGSTPAEYSTKDEFTQMVIEQSDYFRNGRIKLLRQVPLQESAPSQSLVQSPAQPKPADNGNVVINVSCMEDAVEYLKQFGYKSSQLRSKAAIEVAAKTQGVTFVGL